MISAKEAKLQTDRIDMNAIHLNEIVKEIKEAIEHKRYEIWYRGQITKEVIDVLNNEGYDVVKEEDYYFGIAYHISWGNLHDVKE